MKISTVVPKNIPFSFQIAKPVRIAIGGLTLFTILGILLGAGNILRLIFPVASLCVGLFLYFQYPIIYIGFTWWLWFLTPLISRLIDYRSGWDPSRLILVAPYLVTMITTITLFKYLPRTYSRGGLPFILVLAAIGYGTLIGLVNNQVFAVARSFLDWFSPIVFAFHLWINWRDYLRHREIIQSTFLWGVLIMGAYGVIQYLIAPEWDRFWLNESGMFTSSGSPEPLGIRVWSTMHSPGPFAVVMQAGLILLFTHKKPLRIPAAIVGILTFLLTLVRSAWGGSILAMLLFIPSLKSKLQLQIISTILILGLCVLPLATVEPFASKISDRVQTLTNIKKDNSFRARQNRYEENLQASLSQFQGTGLGHTWSFNESKNGLSVTVIDSGVLDLFSTLGWVGAIPYLGGLILMIANLFKFSQLNFDSFLSASKALILSYLIMLIISSGMISVSGLLLWGFIGLNMAGNKFYLKNT
ncbi:hypothetical protein Sta7437_0782 [Stanieria cyanosphaera PCC 7437]|uniref:Glucose-6-phosphate isomerase n=1 Tax=Stanieria cyanosphaera (strain ATCC 29371 / PCC 7437) TaxID=111780 RepID=K9XPB5_STAC7|nr:O-antigen ligase family protein [Stanieria cyanosphaera]AFZ34373.1 hypothetical protein Sta7437_0782 [Stanieria cyanosphaera PCC 7437]